MSIHQARTIRSMLWQSGYRPVSIQTPVDSTDPSAGKVPWWDGRLQPAWEMKARRDPPHAACNEPQANSLNTGILCDGLRAVDIDCEQPETADRIEALAIAHFGRAPKRGRSNSQRRLLLYRAAPGTEPGKRKITGAAMQVEVLGRGQQFVAFGMHTSGVPYIWDHNPASYSRDLLSVVTEDQVTAFLEAASLLIGADPAKVKAATPAAMQMPALPIAVERPEPTQHERSTAVAALREHAQRVAQTTTGSRNDALNREALPVYEMCAAGWISEAEVTNAFTQACYTNGLLHERDGANEVKKTLASARKKGFTQPRPPIVELPEITISGQQGRATMTSSNQTRSVILTRGIEIKEKAIRWLWKGFLPKGKLTILAGDAGTGKSTLAFNLAATVTTGGAWADGSRCTQPGNVLIWSSEDDPADTIKPRLVAAGADPERYGVIDGTMDANRERMSFDPSRDIESLRQAIHAIGGVSLLIIDPIISAVAGDMHRANDVRRSLQPVVDFAQEFDCAVLGITHFAKDGKGKSALHRVVGSQAFAAFARMVLNTVKDYETKQCSMTRAKSNISVDGGGFQYTVHPVTLIGTDIETTVLQWGEAETGSASEILKRAETPDEDNSGSKLQVARRFLESELANGQIRSAKELMGLAKQQNISEKTLRRAQLELNIRAEKNGYAGGWTWQLSPFVDVSGIFQRS